jgi:hypothetical protein
MDSDHQNDYYVVLTVLRQVVVLLMVRVCYVCLRLFDGGGDKFGGVVGTAHIHINFTPLRAFTIMNFIPNDRTFISQYT